MSPMILTRSKLCRDGDHAACSGAVGGFLAGEPCGCACHDGTGQEGSA